MSEVEDLVAQSAPAGRRELTKSQNRAAIMAAARATFAEMSYETASVRDIIRRTDLSVGAFYNYFRSKDEVFTAISDESARRFSPMIKTLRATAPDFETFVRSAISAYFAFLAQEFAERVANRPAGELPPHVQGETPEMTAIFAEVREALEAGIAERHGPAVDSEYLAAACIAVTREVGGHMLARRPVDTAAAADFAVAMILGGLDGMTKA
jgi:AcrR family transcriptional regulator